MQEKAIVKDGRSKKRPGPEHQKRHIVEAAVALFNIHGLNRVSIAQICRRADVGRQTFYRCFADKDALIRHIYQYAVNQQIEDGLSRMAQHQPGEEIRPDLVGQVIDAILERYPYAQFIFIDSGDRNSAACQIIEESLDRVVDAIQQWCAQNELEVPSKTLLKALLAGAHWLVQYAIDSGLTEEVTGEVKLCMLQLFSGIGVPARSGASNPGSS